MANERGTRGLALGYKKFFYILSYDNMNKCYILKRKLLLLFIFINLKWQNDGYIARKTADIPLQINMWNESKGNTLCLVNIGGSQ